MIELSGLTKYYGDFTAVDHLDLQIARGEIFGLLGPNGAGKSTTILMILGLTEPDEGTVRVGGIDPVSRPVEVKRHVGYLPEDVGFYERYTGLENLIFTGRLNGLTYRQARERAVTLLEKVGLGNQMEKKTGHYSRGMRQRLGLADVLIKEPEVIILDEPILGLDPYGVKEFLGTIVRLSREENITVLFSSHHLYQVQQVCDRVGLFVAGRLLAQGDINTLSQQLFGNSAWAVEATVTGGKNGKKAAEVVKEIEGVVSVKEQERKLFIESSKDVTAEVSQALVQAGYGITSLNRKEYGLDDIYYKYFEGGTMNDDL
jgi:ABC-2 type transport system ATP-binding protein